MESEAYVVLHLPIPNYAGLPPKHHTFHWPTPNGHHAQLQMLVDTSSQVHCFFLERPPLRFRAWCVVVDMQADQLRLRMAVDLPEEDRIDIMPYRVQDNMYLSDDDGNRLIKQFIQLD